MTTQSLFPHSQFKLSLNSKFNTKLRFLTVRAEKNFCFHLNLTSSFYSQQDRDMERGKLLFKVLICLTWLRFISLKVSGFCTAGISVTLKLWHLSCLIPWPLALTQGPLMILHKMSTSASFSLKLKSLLHAPLRGRAEPLELGNFC